MEANNTEIETEKECIHLTKNTKGYNWELKIFPRSCSELDEAGKPTGKKEFYICDTDIDRLNLLNNKMIMRFGDNETAKD